MSDAPSAAPAAPAASAAPSPSIDASNPAVGSPGASNAAPAKAAAPVSNTKRYALKVDGVSENLDLDLSNEAEVIKHLQMSKAAQKRMQETASLKKGVADFLEELRSNPEKVLSDPRLNISPEARRKLAEKIMNNELEEMAKSPEQREKERLQAEYEKLKQQVEQEKKGRQEAELRALTEQQAVAIDQSISSAIEKSGLPKIWALAA